MTRPITLATGQWADLELKELCKITSSIGFDGLELMTMDHLFNVDRASRDQQYCDSLRQQLQDYHLDCYAVNAALTGQCVGDNWDPRLDHFVPDRYKGKPEEIRRWAIEQMMKTPAACKNFGVDTVCGFLGSPIWSYFHSYPQTNEKMIKEGFRKIKELWTPIFDEFHLHGVRFAFEVHPAEIAFDYWSTKRLFEELEDHPAFFLNFDPSHLLWQGVDPLVFLQDFGHKVIHVHLKDVAITLDGRNGLLGSHLPFGQSRRGWNFRSLGRGDVDFESIVRILNERGYHGPLSIEWEDNGMDRLEGIEEAFRQAQALNFSPSNLDFDAAMKN